MDIEKIIRQAFAKGESWGVTYSEWFTPSEGDTEAQIQKAITEIKADEKSS